MLYQLRSGSAAAILLRAFRRLKPKGSQKAHGPNDLASLKSNFLNIVSHELRTPLTVVTGAAGMLDEQIAGPLTETQRDLVQMIEQHARRLEHLIAEILDYSSMQAGKTRYQLAEADLGRLVANAAQHLEPAFKTKCLSLSVELAESEMITRLDQDRISQVLMHLLSNALKFTPSPGRVSVEARREGQSFVVTVTDTGIGVPDAQRSQVFDLFHQADESNTRSTSGMGLGLAICKAIVEDGHGGRIWLDSEEGRGTTIAFALPIVAAQPHDDGRGS